MVFIAIIPAASSALDVKDELYSIEFLMALGSHRPMTIYGVKFDREYDIVIADGYPFDIEFWQVNKALDTAGM